jgi:hypothetical protein
MSFPKAPLRLFHGDPFAAFELFHSLPDCGHGFGTLHPETGGLGRRPLALY